MRRLLLAVASIALLAIGLSPSARADEWNKRTTFTVNQSIEVQGKVLVPGTYVIKLLDLAANRHIVQIFNADETELVTTLMAIPNYRMKPAEDTVLRLGEFAPGRARPLSAWFYPGDNFGQAFTIGK